jgi:hypothetical protein
MVQLQPRLPRRRKKDEAPGDRRRQESPSGKESDAKAGHPEERTEPEHHKRKEYDNRLIIGIVAAIAVIVILAVVAYYPWAPPEPTNVVTNSQVRAELARLQGVNSDPMSIDPADYPKVFGTWNNLTLVEQYYCSDVCPDYGRVDLVFQGVTSEQCAQAGGRSLHDLAWGGYIGCEPVLTG